MPRVSKIDERGVNKCAKFSQESSVGVSPEYKELLNVYEVYITSQASRMLKSEACRNLCADGIIDPPGLGPLSYLCAKALGKRFEPNELPPMFTQDPLIMRTYYDALDIELPLEKCYYIEDEKYWYRYVTAKHKDKSVQLQQLNWKKVGITMKFERYLQEIPAEHYHDVEMRNLAEKIKKYVTDLHVEHLRSIHETTLMRYLKRNEDSSSTSSGGMTEMLSSSSSKYEEMESMGAEEEDEVVKEKLRTSAISTALSMASIMTTWSWRLTSIDLTASWYDQQKWADAQEIKRDKKFAQITKKQRTVERRLKRTAREEQEELERELAEREAEEQAILDKIAKKKEARRRRRAGDPTYSIFDMDVEPTSEENLFKDVSDARNPAKLKRELDLLNNPEIAEYCHHIDLRFIRYFKFLSTLRIEFNGPLPPVKYEKWHFDFSTRDIERLAEMQKPHRVSDGKSEGDEEISTICLRFAEQTSVGIPPDDKELVNAYEVYKTSTASRALKSEADKKLCADAIINPLGLGPLSYLSAKALAKYYKPNELPPMLAEDPLTVRAYYDGLDIELPLEKCYNIDDEKYWYRYISTKHKTISLLPQELKWKNIAITKKFEQFIQEQPAEHYDDVEMRELADKIKYFVNDLHVEHLRSIRETTLLRCLKKTQYSSSTSSGMSQTITSSTLGEDEELQEEADVSKERFSTSSGLSDTLSMASIMTTWDWRLQSIDLASSWYDQQKLMDELDIRRDKKHAHQIKKQRRVERRKQRSITEYEEAMRLELAEREAEEQAILAKKARRKEARRRRRTGDETIGVFDMEVEPSSEENLFKDVSDARNPAKLKRQMDEMRHPGIAEFCHHLNLRFLRHFTYLSALRIEFNGPLPPVKYEDWHFDFSTRDIERLADALLSLEQLKLFSLRNSRMNGQKLYIIAKSLKYIYTLQSVDFSYNNLKDDCGEGLYELFQRTTTIKSLELAGNELGRNSIGELAMALGSYEGVCQYLGLGGNPLDSASLALLASYILNTSQVRELCLRGAMVSTEAIKNVIANKLIRHHSTLRGLDLSAITIDYEAACELQSAMISNYKIRKFDIRSCHIAPELELEFEILIKRNKFLFSYPAIGDARKSIDFIDESIAKMRNKILLGAIEEVEHNAQCLERREDEYHHNFAKPRVKPTTPRYTHSFLGDDDAFSEDVEEELREEEQSTTNYPRYHEDPNTFDEDEFKRRFWFFEPPRKIHNVTV